MRDDELAFQLGFHPVHGFELGAHHEASSPVKDYGKIQVHSIEFECVVVVGSIKCFDFGKEAAIRRGVARVNLLFSVHVSVLKEISQSE